MSDRSKVLPQYLLPKKALTVFMGKLAGAQAGALSHWVIRRFVSHVTASTWHEAEDPDIRSYPSFNDFFHTGAA